MMFIINVSFAQNKIQVTVKQGEDNPKDSTWNLYKYGTDALHTHIHKKYVSVYNPTPNMFKKYIKIGNNIDKNVNYEKPMICSGCGSNCLEDSLIG